MSGMNVGTSLELIRRRVLAAIRALVAEGDWRKSSRFSERPLGWRIGYLVGGGLLFAAILRFWVFGQ